MRAALVATGFAASQGYRASGDGRGAGAGLTVCSACRSRFCGAGGSWRSGAGRCPSGPRLVSRQVEALSGCREDRAASRQSNRTTPTARPRTPRAPRRLERAVISTAAVCGPWRARCWVISLAMS